MSAFSDTIVRYIPLVKSKPKIEKKEALAIVPVRHPLVEWKRNGDEVVLTIPTRDDRLARVVKRVVRNLPDTRQIALDDVGSCVWELCDGNRSIDSVVGAVVKSQQLTRREAEVSVTTFLQMLAKRNLVGLMSPGGKKGVQRKR